MPLIVGLPWTAPLLWLGATGPAGGETTPPAPIALVSPTGGEEWSAGSGHCILWQTAPAFADHPIRLELTTDAGRTWDLIAAAAPNTGSFLWRVSDRPSKQCRIKLTDTALDASDTTRREFSITPSQEVRDYRWVNVTKAAAYAPRDGAGALVFGGRMWLLGGWNPGDKIHFPRVCNNEVWSSADGAVWELVKPNTYAAGFDPSGDWEGRHTAGYVVYRGKMWIVGGDANQGHYQDDIWSSSDGARWTLVNKDRPVPWGPRVLHHTLVFRGRIWVMGGQTLPQFAPGPRTVFYDDIWNTSDGVEWTRVVPREPHWSSRGMIGGSVVFRDRMWIIGGGTYDTPDFPKRRFYNDVWSSADGIEWRQQIRCAPWKPRQYHDVAVFDDRLWVLEGWNQVNRNDVWYSADGVNWYELAETPWKPRHAASVFVFEGALWMVAGNNMERDVWKLQRESGG